MKIQKINCYIQKRYYLIFKKKIILFLTYLLLHFPGS